MFFPAAVSTVRTPEQVAGAILDLLPEVAEHVLSNAEGYRSHFLRDELFEALEVLDALVAA